MRTIFLFILLVSFGFTQTQQNNIDPTQIRMSIADFNRASENLVAQLVSVAQQLQEQVNALRHQNDSLKEVIHPTKKEKK